MHQITQFFSLGKHAPDIVEQSANVKELDIYMSDDYSFPSHIFHASNIGKSGWIIRAFTYRDPSPMLLLFKSIVLPRIELLNIWFSIVVSALEKRYTCSCKNPKVLYKTYRRWDWSICRAHLLVLLIITDRSLCCLGIWMWPWATNRGGDSPIIPLSFG